METNNICLRCNGTGHIVIDNEYTIGSIVCPDCISKNKSKQTRISNLIEWIYSWCIIVFILSIMLTVIVLFIASIIQ